MKPHVLVSSAGRRVSLLRALAEAVHERGGRALATDVDSLAPALYVADLAAEVPPVTSPEFVPRLRELVGEHSVGLVVPTIDTELPVLAPHKATFMSEGCHLLVSDPALVAMTADKAQMQEYMRAQGVRVPRGWWGAAIDSSDLPSELFVKPRRGSASKDCFPATRESLADILPLVPDAIVQERLSGPEVTVDALLGLDGTPLHYVPRRRLRTMSGESIQGVTIDDADLGAWILTVLDVLSRAGAIGPVTLQAFLTGDGPVLIEVNPRFGGGFPLTNAAGGHYPSWLVDMICGQPVPPRMGEYQRGLYMTRHHVEIFTTEKPW